MKYLVLPSNEGQGKCPVKFTCPKNEIIYILPPMYW